MRHLDKSYPYQKPSKNRSSKDLNQILGNASVFPNYTKWSNEQLKKFASKCKNPRNCYQETLDARLKASIDKKNRKARRDVNSSIQESK